MRKLATSAGLALSLIAQQGAQADPLFSAPFLSFDVGHEPFSTAIADLNGDRRPDLVVANSRSNTVSVLLGNGDGTFRARTDFGAGRGSLSVAIGDFNADGRPDLALANSGSNTVSVLLNRGSTLDHIRVRRAVVSAPAASGHLAAGELRDGSPALLELVDVTGRVRTSKQVRALGPGTHALELSESNALRAGIYFLRLTQGGSEVCARAAVLQ
jgi:VCBS repeat protein